jgi:hypothetical protein
VGRRGESRQVGELLPVCGNKSQKAAGRRLRATPVEFAADIAVNSPSICRGAKILRFGA